MSDKLGDAQQGVPKEDSPWLKRLGLLIGIPAAVAALLGVVQTLRSRTGLCIVSTTLSAGDHPTLRVALLNRDDAPALITRVDLVFESVQTLEPRIDAMSEVHPIAYDWVVSSDDVKRSRSFRTVMLRTEPKGPDVVEFHFGYEQRNAVVYGRARFELTYNDHKVVRSDPFELRIENGPGDVPEFRFPKGDAELVAALDGVQSALELKQILNEIARRKVNAASPTMQKYFLHPNAAVRIAAAGYFKYVRDSAAVPGLGAMVLAAEPAVKRAALDALGAQGSVAVDEIEYLMDNKDAATRGAMVNLCGKLGDSRCLALVRRALDDRGVMQIIDGQESLVASAALQALARLRMTGDGERVIRELADKNVSVRLAAVDAVGVLRLRGALSKLRAMAASDEPSVREEAIVVLKSLDNKGGEGDQIR